MQNWLAKSVLGMRAERCVSVAGDRIPVAVCVAVYICTASVYREGESEECIGIFRDERCYINVN